MTAGNSCIVISFAEISLSYAGIAYFILNLREHFIPSVIFFLLRRAHVSSLPVCTLTNMIGVERFPVSYAISSFTSFSHPGFCNSRPTFTVFSSRKMFSEGHCIHADESIPLCLLSAAPLIQRAVNGMFLTNELHRQQYAITRAKHAVR